MWEPCSCGLAVDPIAVVVVVVVVAVVEVVIVVVLEEVAVQGWGFQGCAKKGLLWL